ncbi:uncharacterized protein LOC131269783 isoform X2 [Anopheles coustani]|uniref:uncharacterized protein LOC131269783 isoform X2 n=1 Tax=Anopheles coustani TaxID=139045 RepID=UPI00265B4FBF|nr:uncharacterized protein LOC131269783 isoform X2 [Anopheles coustani]
MSPALVFLLENAGTYCSRLSRYHRGRRMFVKYFEPVVGMLARKLRQACTVKHIKCGRWYTRAEQSAEHQVIVIVIVKSEAQNHSCKLFRMKNNLSLRTNTKKKKLNIRLKFIDQRPELCDVQDKGQGTRWKTFRKTCLLTLLAAVVGDKFFN